MSTGSTPPGVVIALGELAAIEGYGLAGVRLEAAESDQEVLERWTALPPDSGVVILTSRAAEVLGNRVDEQAAPMTVVLPR